ncbi:MAG TPA: glycosyltransferase [Vicinamibacterales bacterium]|nr:glycosyltransferase [Vicinamibacterales bacterium]
MPTSCVIVPCYNEANRLDSSEFLAFTSAQPDVHFLFVNDGSRDGTAEVLSRLSQERPSQIHALNLPQNQGKAEAVRSAANAIAGWKAFDYAGFLDADLAAPLATIGQLQAALDAEPSHEFAIGSRVALLGRHIRRHASRHYTGRVFATVVSLMLRLPVYDTQCGAKLFRARLIPELFGDPFVTKWFFDVELIFRLLRSRGHAAAAGMFVEVPLLVWTDQAGSKLRASDFLRTPLELFRIWRRYRESR